jgi:hypothetical protein
MSLFSKILPVKEGCKSWLLLDRTQSTDERETVVFGGFLLLPFLPKIRKLVRVLHKIPIRWPTLWKDAWILLLL